MRDFSIPDTLIVYTSNTAGTVRVSDRHSIVFKTAKTGEKTGRKSAYPVFRQFSETLSVDGERVRTAGIEHAVLDSFVVHKGLGGGSNEDVVRRTLAKYRKAFRREALGTLVRFKYLRAVNRLREFAKSEGFDDVYEKALDVVKVEGGGCFGSVDK